MMGFEAFTVPAFATLIGLAECERKPLPRIYTNLKTERIQYDKTKSHDDLARFDIDTISPYEAGAHTRISGLMSGNINVTMQANVAWSTHMPQRQSCVWYDDITINIISKPVIYIAREHNNHACRHNATLRHEMKHVDVDNRILAKYKPLFEAEVRKAARGIGVIGPVQANGVDHTRSDMNRKIQIAIESVLEELKEERRHRQQQVDSRTEYDRLSRLCGGR